MDGGNRMRFFDIRFTFRTVLRKRERHVFREKARRVFVPFNDGPVGNTVVFNGKCNFDVFYYPVEGSADIGRNESVFTITVFAACYCGYFKTRRAACADLIVYKNSRFLFYRTKRNAAAAAKKICGNGRSEIFTFFLYFTQALSAECIKSHYDKISIEPSNIV